jgi:hypothetical protein
VPNFKDFFVTEAERKNVRWRASLVAVACFLPVRAKDLSFDGIHHNAQGSTKKSRTMVHQAQLIYCVYHTLHVLTCLQVKRPDDYL